MAKTGGVLEVVPTTSVPNSAELKKELQRLVNAILDEEDFSLEITDEAIRLLTALKELKFEKSSDSLKLVDDTVLPDEFKCPISRKLMADPVVLATGQVRDRICCSTFRLSSGFPFCFF